MKDIRYCFLALLPAMLFVLAPCRATAATSGSYKYRESDGKAIINGLVSSYPDELTIPETLDGYPVSSIEAGAFSGCDRLMSVVIGTNITSISDSVFDGCSSLSSVAISSGVTNIGRFAFHSCSSLTSITLPTSINTVGLGVFCNCTSLTNISVVADNPYFSDLDGVLYNKDKTTLLLFPHGKGRGHYSIPGNVIAIGDEAFAECMGMTSVIISDNVKVIGNRAFDYCQGLTNVVIGKGVSSIGGGAFFGANSLKSVYFNATNCTTVSFDYAYWAKSIFGKVEPNACSIHVTIGKDAGQIPDHLFEAKECDALGNLVFTSLYDSLISYQGEISSVVFEQPSSCTRIGKWAFAYNPRLTTLSIPASVREVGECAFWGCSNLTSMTLPGHLRPEGANYLEAVSILDGSSIIKESMFAKGMPALIDGWQPLYDYDGKIIQTVFSHLTTVTIPASVTSIGASAFMDCTSLSSITIPANVTSIGYSSFSGCSSLASLRLLDCPATIGSEAFMNCTNLSSVVLGDKVEAIESLAFDHCVKIPAIIIPSSTKRIDSNAFSDCWSLMTVTIPDTVSAVEDYAFYNCPAIRTASLPSSILPLRRIFSDYQAITSVTMGNTSTNIPDYAFEDCTSLISVTLPDQIQTIGYAAFFNCTSLQVISLPSRIVSLGDWAFSCCASLDFIEMPSSLRSIGARAFSYCDRLTHITIPEGVTRIGDWAFAWNPNLAGITYLCNAPTVGTDIYSASFSDVRNYVMPWTTGWGSTFAERPVERCSAQLCAPSITPPDGHVFQSSASIIINKTAYIISLGTNTYPAILRYTRDGSDPTPSSPAYSRFSVTNDTIVKARFFGEGGIFSETATVRLFKGSYNGAMDLQHALNFYAPPSVSTNTGWFPQMYIANDGQAAAQSPQLPDYGESAFTIPLAGPGQVSFQWKTSCEKDDTGAMNWDYVSVMLDGAEIARQDGETDWLQVSFAIPDGDHEVSIAYRKDEVLSAGDDCAWVDNFAFMPNSPLVFSLGGESFEVPVSSNFTLNVTQTMINSAVTTYSSAFPSATPDDIRTLLSTADAMGLSMGLLGQGTNILLFSPKLLISGILFSNQGAPSNTPPDQVAITFTVENGITPPSEAVAILRASSSRRLEILARSQLAGTTATIIPVSTQFSNGAVTVTFQLLAPPPAAFFRIRLANQLDPI